MVGIAELAAVFDAPSSAVKASFLLGANGIIVPHDDGVRVTLPAGRARGLNGDALFVGDIGTSLWFPWPMGADEIDKVGKAVGLGCLPESKLTYYERKLHD